MKLRERADLVCRQWGMSGRTAQVYFQRSRRHPAFSAAARGGWVRPEQLGTGDVVAFLNHLVGERRLTPPRRPGDIIPSPWRRLVTVEAAGG